MNRGQSMTPSRARIHLRIQAIALNEWHGAVAMALGILVLAWLPALVFPSHPLPGHVNDGVISISDDMPQYLSAIRQGAQGHLLWLDQFTTAPVGRILMYPLYTVSGLLLAPLHWTPIHIFTLLRLAADAGLLAALWLLVRACAPAHRLAAYALCLLNAGGMGLYLLVNPNPIPFLNGSFGLMQMLLLPPPHVAAGVACEMLALVVYRRSRHWRGYVALCGLLLVLGLIYPFGLPTVTGICGADALIEVLERRRITRRLPAVGSAIAPAATIPLYYWWLFHHAPVWSTSVFLTDATWPPLSLLAWLYAPTLLLALPAAWRRTDRLLALWPLMALASGVVSGAQPQRMLAGLSVPLAVLAVQTLSQRPRLLRPAILGLGLGGLLLPFLFVAVVRANAGRVFMPEPLTGIGAYLATRTTSRDVVLADYGVGNLLVALMPARIIAGHGSQTLDLAVSGPVVRDYFTWSQARRYAAEDRYRVTYVVVRTDLYHRLTAKMVADRRYTLVYTAGSYALFHRMGSERAG